MAEGNTNNIQLSESSKSKKLIYVFIIVILAAAAVSLWFLFGPSKSRAPEESVNVSSQPKAQQLSEENDPYSKIDTLETINRDLNSVEEVGDVNLEEIDRDLNSL